MDGAFHVSRAALAFMWLCTFPACGAQAPTIPGDVVLISVDTLRPDHLGIYGYSRETSPALDARFAAGAVFERAYSTEASTPPSTVSLLTGLLPQEHRVRLFYQLLPASTQLLTDRLPESYQTAAFVSNVVLTDEALGLGRRFDHYDDWVDEREPNRPVWERSARRTTAAALSWLAAERDPQRPLFLWVHYIDPHGPYRAPEPTKRFAHTGHIPTDDSRIHAYQRDPEVEDALDYVDRYDEEVAYVDAEIERLLVGYERGRPLNEALVIFTADHGESMIEHERWFTHGYHVYDEIIRIPLLLLGPGVEPRRERALASLVDVAPTILGFAGGDASGLAGRDLRTGAGRAERTVFAEASSKRGQLRAAIGRDYKSIVQLRSDSRMPVARFAYDLAVDPGELSPLSFDSQAGAARELLALIESDPDPAGVPRQPERGERLAAPKVSPRAGPAELEKLRALGYVE